MYFNQWAGMHLGFQQKMPAIKNNVHPEEWTRKNIAHMKGTA
jgi:hypothetical protein